MQFNKNKIIFFAIVGILLVGFTITLLLANLNRNNTKRSGNQSNASGVNIWMVSENPVNMLDLIKDFQNAFPKYQTKKIEIETFTNYEEYTYALASAFASENGPDIFMLNNNETSVFADHVGGIPPSIIKPIDFRKSFKTIFSDDLIVSVDDKTEFLAGVPVGYETLGVFYNKRYLLSGDLATISQMNRKIAELKKENKTVLPIALGNGTTVDYAADIVTQMFLLNDDTLEGVKNIATIGDAAIADYVKYGIEGAGNGFNGYYSELKTNGKTSSYMLANNMATMAIGYPRFLERIEEELSSKNKRRFKTFLAVEPFPYYTSGIGKTFVNYDYFVMNKNSLHAKIAQDFLLYLATEQGAKKYLSLDSYKLPALVALEKDLETKKIHKDYTIVLSNFIPKHAQLSSFNKGIKNIYDREMIEILDMGENFKKAFSKFTSQLVCRADKIETLKLLSVDCNR